jgi:hypothetical protein
MWVWEGPGGHLGVERPVVPERSLKAMAEKFAKVRSGVT